MNNIITRPAPDLTRPPTLRTDGRYFLANSCAGSPSKTLTPIRFVKYDPCPAFVIIETQDGTRCRWPRDDVRRALDSVLQG